jgi:hypothetical protein
VGLGMAPVWSTALATRVGSGKMAAHKGARPWSGTMAQRLQGGLDDSAEALGRTR